MVNRRTKKTENVTAIRAGEDDPALKAFLEKGGSTAKAETQESDATLKPTRFSLTIPGDICQEVDNLCNSGRIKTSRHKWVLEAIIEKLERDAPISH